MTEIGENRMKWEYLSGVIGDYVDAGKDYIFVGAIINEDHRITFNELGEKGWELVSIVKGIAYFKREQQKVDLGKETVEIMKQILEQGIEQND